METVGLYLLLLAQPNGARFFGKQGLACLKRRSCKLRARQKNRAERGKFGEAKPVPAVAFLLLPFLWRSKEKEVPAPAGGAKGNRILMCEGYLKVFSFAEIPLCCVCLR